MTGFRKFLYLGLNALIGRFALTWIWGYLKEI